MADETVHVHPAAVGRQLTRLRTVWVTEPSQRSFEDEYETIKQVGEDGQFAKAYQCKRKSDGLIFVEKRLLKARIYRLHPADTIRQSLLKSMQSEIDVMKHLDHKYICKIYDTIETKHSLHIIMEECKGGELFDRIKAKRRYPEQEAKPIIRMMLSALHYMHGQHRVVHCDLKPDNVLFADESETSDIKIIDFGMSKVLPRMRSLRELCGTPYYTAPEIINGDYSHAADMWSTGVIAYVMIFGFPPFYVDPLKFQGVKETKEIYKLILQGFDPQVKKGYGAWFPRAMENKLSTDGMDFIAHLMEKDVANRLTAKEALQHPWLTSDDIKHDNAASDDEIDDTVAIELGNFAQANQFKFAITSLFRDQYEEMRPKHFENLRKVFDKMDKDGNKRISYEEFEEGMLKTNMDLDKGKIQKMFAELDFSKSGEIDFNNFLNAAVHDYLVASDVRLYKAFRDLDKNEAGHLNTDVLKQKIKDLNPYGNVDVLLKIIDDADLDNNGTIDYDEFLRALHPDFNETPDWFWNEQQNKDADEGDGIDYDLLYKQLDLVVVHYDNDDIGQVKPVHDEEKSETIVRPFSVQKQALIGKAAQMQIKRIKNESSMEVLEYALNRIQNDEFQHYESDIVEYFKTNIPNTTALIGMEMTDFVDNLSNHCNGQNFSSSLQNLYIAIGHYAEYEALQSKLGLDVPQENKEIYESPITHHELLMHDDSDTYHEKLYAVQRIVTNDKIILKLQTRCEDEQKLMGGDELTTALHNQTKCERMEILTQNADIYYSAHSSQNGNVLFAVNGHKVKGMKKAEIVKLIEFATMPFSVQFKTDDSTETCNCCKSGRRPQNKNKNALKDILLKWLVKFMKLSLNILSKASALLDAVTDIILLYKAANNEAIELTMILFITLFAPYILSYSSGVQIFLHRKYHAERRLSMYNCLHSSLYFWVCTYFQRVFVILYYWILSIQCLSCTSGSVSAY